MNFEEAQKDMRMAYIGGGTGALISGLVWIVAGFVGFYTTALTSVLVFFFGGMFIFPLSSILSKYMKVSGKHSAKNPLAKYAMLSTFLIFIGLLIGYFNLYSNPNYFYPIMLLAIGVRYMLFQLIYGLKLYWIFGATLIVLGSLCFMNPTFFYTTALMGGVTELFFAILLINRTRKYELDYK